MRRAEYYAIGVLCGLLAIAAALLACAVYYGTASFWAGGLAALGQSVLAGVALYGLRLARQRAELEDIAAPVVSREPAEVLGGFRMSMADETGGVITRREPAPLPVAEPDELQVVETGFQRMLVGIAAAVQLGVAAIIAAIVYSNMTNIPLGKTIAISKVAIDPLAIIVALGAVALYAALQWMTRPVVSRDEDTDSLNGLMTMALPGIVAMAAAVVLARFGVAYAGETAALVIVGLLVLQAAELLVNALKSYAGIEEFDQDPIDLQKTPLTPMLTSMSIEGVRILIAQTFGLQETKAGGEPGVMARMMPRVLIALIALALFISCFRVVPAGEVAIRERLGQATDQDIDHPLQAGLHFTAPWPVDRLVEIPTAALREVTVGTEEPTPEVDGKKLDFRFWTIRHTAKNEDEENFVTGDMSSDGKPASQMLGTFVSIWWRVKNPSDFYRHLSHSTFVYGGAETPIYQAIIQAEASQAVTRSFAQHRMDEILGPMRHEIELHCKAMLQRHLDALHSGILIADLAITDVHPPIGIGQRPAPNSPLGFEMGPANAYEFVVQSQEYQQQVIDKAQAYYVNTTSAAQGDAARIKADASTKAVDKVTQAAKDTARYTQAAHAYGENPRLAQDWFLFKMLDAQLPGVKKIILGKGVEPPDVYQRTKGEPLMIRPPVQ